jgi:hypothetical protein
VLTALARRDRRTQGNRSPTGGVLPALPGLVRRSRIRPAAPHPTQTLGVPASQSELPANMLFAAEFLGLS